MIFYDLPSDFSGFWGSLYDRLSAKSKTICLCLKKTNMSSHVLETTTILSMVDLSGELPEISAKVDVHNEINKLVFHLKW